jgi:hypothetical protein
VNLRHDLRGLFEGRFYRGLFALTLLLSLNAQGATQTMVVYKLATCSCCLNWVNLMKANGFEVTVHNVTDTTIYGRKYGVPDALESCHVAIVGGYVIVGHVPISEIRRLLKEHPAAKGLTVPGMPVGAPGMEEGTRRDAYSVVLVDGAGKTSVYRSYAQQ